MDITKFLIILFIGILGNGIGAWNIRTISSGRLGYTMLFTFIAAILNMSAIREISRDIDGVYILAWAIGSMIGITFTTFIDKKWCDKKKYTKDVNIV
mgnify:CR=1 FL=1